MFHREMSQIAIKKLYSAYSTPALGTAEIRFFCEFSYRPSTKFV